MYVKYYDLKTQPFRLTPDHRFFFGSNEHSRALSHLVYGLTQEEGFIVVTGEVGSGKTTLIERLWAQLDRWTYLAARIDTTQVSPDDLLRLVALRFGIDLGEDKATLLRRLEEALRVQAVAGRRCLLIVDEVQTLPLASLEELRMLSNFSEKGRALMQTILLGQPQFRATLASSDLDQLRQRVLASYHLGPLNKTDTRAYILHRLRAAGWQQRPAWEEETFSEIYRHTDGIPRRINRLCGRVLLQGALEHSERITAAMVEETATELDADLSTGQIESDEKANGEVPSFPGDEPLRRLEALERTVLRRERMFERLLELLSGNGGGGTL